MSDAMEYGLPSVRDSDGNLQPVDHTFRFNGREVTIQVVPPTVAEMDQYEGLGDEVSFADLFEIVDRHLVRPSLEGTGTTTSEELICYLQGIMEVGSVGGTTLAQDVHDALEDREGTPGN